jgi:hypothetical protein
MEDDKLLRQKEEELENLKANYNRVMKVLQSKKVESQAKNQNSNWKAELVKRNQDVALKQQLISSLEEKLEALSNEKERENRDYQLTVRKLENQLVSLKNELITLHSFIKVLYIIIFIYSDHSVGTWT